MDLKPPPEDVVMDVACLERKHQHTSHDDKGTRTGLTDPCTDPSTAFAEDMPFGIPLDLDSGAASSDCLLFHLDIFLAI